MHEEFFKDLKKRIELRYYTISDIMTCEFGFEGFSKKNKKNHDDLTRSLVSDIKLILSSGELPHLNPDFLEYSTDGIIEDDKLFEYIKSNAYYVVSDLDKSNFHVSVLLDMGILFLNLSQVDEDYLQKINCMKVKSFMGESEIGQSKKEL